LTLLVAPGVLASLVYGCWIVRDLTTAHEFVGVSLSVGLITGAIGIVAGHELCHKATSIERMAGRFLLCAVAYGHFYIEHTMGHHKHVATDADPATARYGESFHAFLPRVVIGEWRSAWHIERERLRKKELDWWCNEILLYYACSAAICSRPLLMRLSKPLKEAIISADRTSLCATMRLRRCSIPCISRSCSLCTSSTRWLN